MNNNLIKLYVSTLGLIEFIIHATKEANAEDLRKTLLAAVMADLAEKLMENKEFSAVINGVTPSVKTESDLLPALQKIQERMVEAKIDPVLLAQYMQHAASSVLKEFAEKIGKPEISDLVDLAYN